MNLLNPQIHDYRSEDESSSLTSNVRNCNLSTFFGPASVVMHDEKRKKKLEDLNDLIYELKIGKASTCDLTNLNRMVMIKPTCTHSVYFHPK